MTENALTPMATFEEKVKGKLKETIADMLPDAVLSDLVKRVMEEQFFRAKVVTDSRGYSARTEPPWFVTEVTKLAEPILRQHVEAAFAERKDQIEAEVAKFVEQQNLALLMSAKIADGMSGNMFSHAQRIVEMVNQRRY
jgi:hypothetical protein